MNKWDRVEKKKRITTEFDLQWIYIKMVFWIVIFAIWMYFTFGGTI